MNILAVNGSPHKDEGNTALILEPFMQGAREAGAETETVNLQGIDLKPCLGCFNCWTTTPGVCVHKDGMADLIPLLAKADVLVAATPLYCCTVSAQLKLFFDRTIPYAEPYVEIRDGLCTHPARRKDKTVGLVLISNCGFHEMDHFTPMVDQMKLLARVGSMDYRGELLRPHGPMMRIGEKFFPDAIKAVKDAAMEAGREVARGGSISAETAAAVSRDLLPREVYVEQLNGYFDQILNKE